MRAYSISDREFTQFRNLMLEKAGIHLSSSKVPLVVGRLSRRLRSLELAGFEDYFRLITDGAHPEELQTAIDLLTTNETRFFREPRHFEILEALARESTEAPFRVWSAACSSGEEAYTIAMVLADALRARPWEVLASDLSTRVLAQAREGLYPLERAEGIPAGCLQRHCLKGQGAYEGTFIIEESLRARVRFRQINLNAPLPAVGQFDAIFLRNVMIYFDLDTKRAVVQRLLPHLKRGGHLFVGHSETLNGVVPGLTVVAPAVYRRS